MVNTTIKSVYSKKNAVIFIYPKCGCEMSLKEILQSTNY